MHPRPQPQFNGNMGGATAEQQHLAYYQHMQREQDFNCGPVVAELRKLNANIEALAKALLGTVNGTEST